VAADQDAAYSGAFVMTANSRGEGAITRPALLKLANGTLADAIIFTGTDSRGRPLKIELACADDFPQAADFLRALRATIEAELLQSASSMIDCAGSA
jgi:hypothetical protein